MKTCKFCSENLLVTDPNVCQGNYRFSTAMRRDYMARFSDPSYWKGFAWWKAMSI